MSTKSTLWYNDDIHFYREAFDDENVYLELRLNAPYVEDLVIKIPLEAWKEMRKHTIQPNEDYLGLTDAELLTEAKRSVAEHRTRIAEIRRDAGAKKELRLFWGSGLFGSPDASEDEMVRNFIEHYRPNIQEGKA